jgi:hypothetical protein
MEPQPDSSPLTRLEAFLAEPQIRSDPVARLDNLLADVRNNLRPGAAGRVQSELARLLKLLPCLRTAEHAHLIGSAEVAVAALLAQKPNMKLAKSVRESIQLQVSPASHPMTAVVREGGPPSRVILGLGTLLFLLLYVATPLAVLQLPSWLAGLEEFFGIQAQLFVIVAVGGAVGSIVSMMARIQDFAGLKGTDPSVLFFTGFFKPVIGASFALFIFALIQSGLIPVTIKPGTEKYFLLALSFICGFSERLARDVVSSSGREVGQVATTVSGGAGSKESEGARDR